MVASEYIFKPDPGEVDEQGTGYTTLTNGYSELERIYVNGPSIDEPLFCAIDTDQNGTLTIDNDPECEWAGGLETRICDVAFYYITDRMGSIAALSAKNDDQTILEYYRYRGYGEAIVMPIKDLNSNWVEDTPTDLSDNIAKPISTYGNTYTFTARRLDDATGMMYYRARQYSPLNGRFVSADPLQYVDGPNLFQYCLNAPTRYVDPSGKIVVGVSGWQASIFFGVFGNGGDANGVDGYLDDRIPDLGNWANQGGNSTVFASWTEVNDCDDAKTKAIAAHIHSNPGEPVILVGHSFGGDSIYHLAECLCCAGIAIDLFVTLDPVGVGDEGRQRDSKCYQSVTNNGCIARRVNYAADSSYLFIKGTEKFAETENILVANSNHASIVEDVQSVTRANSPVGSLEDLLRGYRNLGAPFARTNAQLPIPYNNCFCDYVDEWTPLVKSLVANP